MDKASQPCWVLASDRQPGAYLYLAQEDGFAQLPLELQRGFGAPRSLMQLELGALRRLAQADLGEVRHALRTQGFYLQLPPQIQAYLRDGEY
jgi:uncharacterized protein YcgL (UPF0745 family)